MPDTIPNRLAAHIANLYRKAEVMETKSDWERPNAEHFIAKSQPSFMGLIAAIGFFGALTVIGVLVAAVVSVL